MSEVDPGSTALGDALVAVEAFIRRTLLLVGGA
jgi:hypothetical protein